MTLKGVENDFLNLIDQVQQCTLCPRMLNSSRILGASSGSLDAKIMFIGEAPGRLGADDTRVPFHGDKTGHNFEEFLRGAGISRYDIFITNAVLCNPKDPQGNNASPNRREYTNCSQFLKKQLDLVNPKIVVTLGLTALNALFLIDTHDLSLKEHVRTENKWYNRTLIPLYHPGQRAMLHRNFHNQCSDYEFVASRLRNLQKNRRKKVYGTVEESIVPVLERIFEYKPYISYFALHKLFFLIEYYSKNELSEKLTSSYFIRQLDGPYCTDLHISKLKKAFPSIKTKYENGQLHLFLKDEKNLFKNHKGRFTKEQEEFIYRKLKKYGDLNNQNLKRVTYMTQPMRAILRQEKSASKTKEHLSLYNKPILF